MQDFYIYKLIFILLFVLSILFKPIHATEFLFYSSEFNLEMHNLKI